MKRLILLAGLLFLLAGKCSAQTSIQSGPTDPTFCTPGAYFYNTTSASYRQCASANTWAAAGGGLTQVATLDAVPCTNNKVEQLTVAPFSTFICIGGAWQPQAPAAGIVYATSYGAKGLWQVESNGANWGVANASQTVNCSTCKFQTSTYHPAAVGDDIFATSWNGNDTNYPASVAVIGLSAVAPCTITNINSDTQVTESCTSSGVGGTNNGNAGALAWGPDDQVANHAAKVAAYDTNPGRVMQLAGPITNMNLPDFNAATSEGFSGGTTASKYIGIIGDNPSGNTTILLPPWFGLGNIAGLCTFGSQGTGCFGGVGGMFNITFNGLGQSSFALGGHVLVDTANDSSYMNDYEWGFATASVGSVGIDLNQGLHIGINIIVDGAGATPCWTNGTVEVNHLFSLECYNGTSGNGNLWLGQNTKCFSCVIEIGQSSGFAVNAVTFTYWGYGDDIVNPGGVASTAYTATTGTIHVDGTWDLQQNCATCSSFNITGAGIATSHNSLLAGGGTAGVWTGGATATYIDQGGNSYTTSPITGASVRLIGVNTSQTPCAVNSASPAACGSAPTGAFVVPTLTASYTVNTQAVTANSVIHITPRTYTGNLPSAPTCVVPTITAEPVVSAIVAGTSFTITFTSTTGQTCWNYEVIN